VSKVYPTVQFYIVFGRYLEMDGGVMGSSTHTHRVTEYFQVGKRKGDSSQTSVPLGLYDSSNLLAARCFSTFEKIVYHIDYICNCWLTGLNRGILFAKINVAQIHWVRRRASFEKIID